MLKAIKIRIYPTKSQEKLLNESFNACRYIYNLALEYKISYYKSTKKSLSYNQICQEFKDIRNSTEWLQNIPMQVYQQSFKGLEKAYSNFFKGSGFPKFKSKRGKQSIRFTNQTISKSLFYNNRIKINKDLNLLFSCSDRDYKYLLKYKESIKNITISKVPCGLYFASILVDGEISYKLKTDKIVGIDLGIKNLLTLSDGEVISNERFLDKSLNKLKKLQRRLSKKIKGSKNRNKARLLLAKQHYRIGNKRLNLLHNITSKLINENQVIILEDLNIKGMVENHKLAKSISDLGLGELYRQLEYKANWHNREFIYVDRFFPSSKTCSCCGNVKQDLTLSDRVYNCASCGLEMDRDLNAARNILDEGIKMKNRVAVTQIEACGLSSSGKSSFGLDFSYDRTKQEYLEVES